MNISTSWNGYLNGKLAGRWSENQSRAGDARTAVHVFRSVKTGSFQAALISRGTEYKQDTLTISDPSVRTGTADMDVPQAADSNAILPTDSTEVKLEKLRRIAETADYTGMSYGEIYKTILDRYQQAFDGKFLAMASGFVGGSDRDSICHQFARERDQAV